MTADDLARWQAIRRDGRVNVKHYRGRGYWMHCAECGHEYAGLAGAPMIDHWTRSHARKWREAT